MQDLMGSITGHEELEKIWRESLQECKARLDRITYEDFMRLMKGQSKDKLQSSFAHSSGMLFASSGAILETMSLPVVPEGELPSHIRNESLSVADLQNVSLDAKTIRHIFGKKRSRSYEEKASVWEVSMASYSYEERMHAERDASRAVLLSSRSDGHDSVKGASSLVANRQLYRKHREMRMAVLEASKQFDKKRDDYHFKSEPIISNAGLIMKRGARPPVELEDAHRRALFEAAAKRCGRTRQRRNKTVSDVTGMMLPGPGH